MNRCADRQTFHTSLENAEAALEDDLASPPRRKGKGGRQRAPAPDATVDPKRAKRIMANRASAAKSKEKQKQKVMVSSFPEHPDLLAVCLAMNFLHNLQCHA